jgi:hypothetical protein
MGLAFYTRSKAQTREVHELLDSDRIGAPCEELIYGRVPRCLLHDLCELSGKGGVRVLVVARDF